MGNREIPLFTRLTVMWHLGVGGTGGWHIAKTDVKIRDVKFASGIKNISFGFYPYTDVC